MKNAGRYAAWIAVLVFLASGMAEAGPRLGGAVVFPVGDATVVISSPPTCVNPYPVYPYPVYTYPTYSTPVYTYPVYTSYPYYRSTYYRYPTYRYRSYSSYGYGAPVYRGFHRGHGGHGYGGRFHR